MLHFFRRIRRDLLANSQFFKYLKYAVGEIVLVVLGILIALFINNQNEQRKETEKFNQVLVEVEKELEYNIFVSKFYVKLLGQFDSAYVKLFIDSVKIKDYSYFNGILAGGNPDWVIQEESYAKLDQSFKFNDEQDSILSDLKWLYGALKDRARYSENQLIENKKENREKFESYDWYTSWRFENLNDKRILDFYNNDSDYLKLAAKNFGLYSEYRGAVQSYEIFALKVYKSIFEYLKINNLKHSDSLLYEQNPDEFKHYLGKYNPKWVSDNDLPDDSCAISLENGKLYWNGYRSDLPDSRFEIFPIGRYSFSDERGGNIYLLEFDKQGEVKGVRFLLGPQYIYELEKVR